MDVTTGNRFHLVEILLSSGLRLAVIPVFGIRFGDLVLYETLLQVVVQLHHANVGLPGWLDRALGWVIVTPSLHKVHHSRLRPETDSNYAAFLSVWDRVFRSRRTRANPAQILFGLDGFDGAEQKTLLGMFRGPR